jgi:hypothetical protein
MGIKYRSCCNGSGFNIGARYSKEQLEDPKIQEIKEQIKDDKAPRFSVDDHGMLWYKNCLFVPKVKEI